MKRLIILFGLTWLIIVSFPAIAEARYNSSNRTWDIIEPLSQWFYTNGYSGDHSASKYPVANVTPWSDRSSPKINRNWRGYKHYLSRECNYYNR